MQQFKIRLMLRDDVDEFLRIEEASFFSHDAWTKKDLMSHMGQDNCRSIVATLDGKIVSGAVYELNETNICLINIVVDSAHQNRRIALRMIIHLQSFLTETRKKIIALVPELCRKTKPFFDKCNVDVRWTKKKGFVTYDPSYEAIARNHVDEIQGIENDVGQEYGREPRDIARMLANFCYGTVILDKLNGGALGFVIYTRESGRIYMDGKSAVTVRFECRGNGFGQDLWEKVTGIGFPITVFDIDLSCQDQVGFLEAMGVFIPELQGPEQKYVTAKWEPRFSEPAAS